MQEEFLMTMIMAAASAFSMMAAGTLFPVMVMRTDSIRIIAETSL